jgi:hypothetical protein
MTERVYGIGGAARAAGVSVKAIRYDEEIGLIPRTRRRANGGPKRALPFPEKRADAVSRIGLRGAKFREEPRTGTGCPTPAGPNAAAAGR